MIEDLRVYNRIIELLKNNNIQYEEYRHQPVISSEDAQRVRGDASLSQGAKAIVIKLKESNYVLVVLQGDKRINSKKIKQYFKVSEFRFANEEELINVTNGVLRGGVPPFGSVMGLQTYVDKQLLTNEYIFFNAGSRSISMKLNTKDYIEIEKPIILEVV